MILAESAGLTDTGQKRKQNEDDYCIDDSLGLYVVADGMGGHAAGEVASRIAIETIRDYAGNVFQKQGTEELPDVGRNLSTTANQLLASIYLANRNVYDMARKNPAYAGMGTTVAAVMLTSDDTFISVNVGDSPVFLIRNGRLEMMSMTHTVASEVFAANQDADAALRKEFSHVLTQAIGTKNQVNPAVEERACRPGDIFVICSDGLTDMVTTAEIKDLALSQPPAEACQKMIDLANANGGQDNITVIVLKINKIVRAGGLLRRMGRFFKRSPENKRKA